LIGGALWGQGSGTSAPPPSVGGADGQPFRVTRTLTGEILKWSEGVLTVRDERKGQTVELKLDEKVRLAADRRGEFAGRRVTRDDLRAGLLARVTYGADDRVALEIRLLAAGKR
jgi:hypothetical protein